MIKVIWHGSFMPRNEATVEDSPSTGVPPASVMSAERSYLQDASLHSKRSDIIVIAERLFRVEFVHDFQSAKLYVADWDCENLNLSGLSALMTIDAP